MAVTPGGRVGDASPLGHKGGPRQLDDYVRMVAHALMKRGMSESHAIAVAKNSLKRWRRGGGRVRPQVQAGAAGHLANQERLDKSRGGRGVSLSVPVASVQDGGRVTLPGMAIATKQAPFRGAAAPFGKGGGKKKGKIRKGSIPSGKGKGKFPITSEKSVHSAAALLSKAKGVSKETVIKHVRAEAKKRGLKLTPAFKPKGRTASLANAQVFTPSEGGRFQERTLDLVGPKGYSHGWVRAGGPLPRSKGGKSRANTPTFSRTKAPAPKGRGSVSAPAEPRSIVHTGGLSASEARTKINAELLKRGKPTEKAPSNSYSGDARHRVHLAPNGAGYEVRDHLMSDGTMSHESGGKTLRVFKGKSNASKYANDQNKAHADETKSKSAEHALVPGKLSTVGGVTTNNPTGLITLRSATPAQLQQIATEDKDPRRRAAASELLTRYRNSGAGKVAQAARVQKIANESGRTPYRFQPRKQG